MPSLISSQVFWPTSLMNIRPVPGWNANVNGLRRPSAQIARFAPVAVSIERVRVGIAPSALMRRILPRRLPSVCAFAPFALSPTAM